MVCYLVFMSYDKSILVLAPHLTSPFNNGADILLRNRIDGFINNFKHVTIIRNGFIDFYIDSNKVESKKFKNFFRSKNMSALMTIINSKSYLYNKFNTSSYKRVLDRFSILDKEYNIVYYSFIHTADAYYLLCRRSKAHFVETHNDDIVWYNNLYQHAGNFLAKIVAYKSIKYTKRFLKNYSDSFVYLALNDNDKAGYLEYINSRDIWVIPAGIKIDKEMSLSRDNSEKELVLIFVGSLDVNMNYDALVYFSNLFYPHIINKIGLKVRVNIVGRNPSNRIKKLCKENGWTLFPNVTNTKLKYLLCNADFMLLPFPYTTGTKMKLLEAFLHNLPVLATNVISKQINLTKYKDYNYGVFSDNPSKWISCIKNIGNTDNLNKIANDFSCKKVNQSFCERMVGYLEPIIAQSDE